jgi:hypothetical protein
MMKHPLRTVSVSIFILFFLLGAAGIALGFLYASLPGHDPQKNRQACEIVGGDWSEEDKRCLVSYKESGAPCRDGGQCISGICVPPALSDAQKTALAQGPIPSITGTCSADLFPTGCIPQVLMGTISRESLCLEE